VCLDEADINLSGYGVTPESPDPMPVCGDITIGDISILIDYLFISGPDNYYSDPGYGVGNLAPCP
jgi:hypothetical protein